MGRKVTGDFTALEINKYLDNKIKAGDLLLSKNNTEQYNKLFTTKAVLEQEKSAMKMVLEGKGQCNYVYSQKDLTSLLKDTTLNEGQKSGAKLVLCSKDRIIGIQGNAGVGKTYAFGEINKLAQAKDINIVGLAPTHRAAEMLEQGSNISSNTTRSFLTKYADFINGNHSPQRLARVKEHFKSTFVVVDESSLINTTDFHGLCKLSHKLDFKLIFSGDVRQLGAVEAGKPFLQAQDIGMQTAHISEIVRQDNQKIKESAYMMTDGVDKIGKDHFQKALENISHDVTEVHPKVSKSLLAESISKKTGVEVVVSPIAKQKTLSNTAVKQWKGLNDAQRNETLIIAPSRKIRNQVMEGVRDILFKEGKIGNSELHLTRLERHEEMMTPARMKQTENYQKGDYIEFGKAIPRFAIKEAGRYRVKHVDAKFNRVVLENEKGKETVIRPEELNKSDAKFTSVYTKEEIKIAEGEKLRWTKISQNPELKKHIKNGAEFKITKIGKKYITLEHNKGQSLQLKITDPHLNHIDYAYASTVYSAQGLTSKRVLAILESSHPKLTTQRMALVSLTRAKSYISIITDSIKKLNHSLSLQTGDKTTAMSQQNINYQQFGKDIPKISQPNIQIQQMIREM